MESSERTTKSLFELNAAEFVGSLIGITNGKDGLALAGDEGDEGFEFGGEERSSNTLPLTEKNLSVGVKAISLAENEADLSAQEGVGLTCRTCAITFDGVDEQREHFRFDWHRCNVKRKLEKKSPLSEADFEKMIEGAEVSSISGSDSSDSEDSDGEEGSTTFRGQSHFVEFQTSKGMHTTICKTLLMQNPRENVTVEEVIARVPSLFTGKIWTYFMCSGGHFAGVCFNGDKVIAHKTIHKYTVRRKQGGSQLAQDSSGKKAKSAGASIRRHNELALQQEIRALLVEWAGHLRDSHYIFIQAPSFNRQIFFGYEETPFKKGDDRLRKIPFTTRRPTFSEVKRLHALISAVTFSTESIYQRLIDEAQLDRLRREKEKEAKKEKQRKKEAEKEKEKEKKEAEKQGTQGAEGKVRLTKEEEKAFQVVKKGKADLLATLLENPELNLDAVDERGWALLHVAANEGNEEMVTMLLAKGASPLVMVNGLKSKTPYNYSKTKEVRNAFRRLMAREPTKWDYAVAQIPSPLTEDMEKLEREKEAQLEKERKKRDKKKKKKSEAAQKDSDSEDEDLPSGSKKQPPPRQAPAGLLKTQAPKVQQASPEVERERRARAAEQRLLQQQVSLGVSPVGLTCAFCQRSLQGLVPFERLEFKYCTTKCVADHRKEINR